jgi:hypothetical protein
MATEQPLSSSSIPPLNCSICPPPKFRVGDLVCWFRVPTQDFGIVVEQFYGMEGSVRELGWHYRIQLDPDSPSFDYCKTDYGFEEDLALMEPGENDAVE